MSQRSSLEVLIVSKGHDYDHSSFLNMFASFEGIEATLVEHPAAETVLASPDAQRYEVVFFYDMCGIPGLTLSHDGSNGSGRPSAGYEAAIERLLERGTGLVLVNHATVGWANWPLWREISGSSFMLSAGELHGASVPGSGYRGGHGPLPNATVRLVPDCDTGSDHPVLAGLSQGFDITDELYLKTDRYGARVIPLLRADYEFVCENFSPPPLASADEQANWAHDKGSNLLVWANVCRNSPIVVSDVGDGPLAYDNASYRTLIENACRWVASADARRWVASLG